MCGLCRVSECEGRRRGLFRGTRQSPTATRSREPDRGRATSPAPACLGRRVPGIATTSEASEGENVMVRERSLQVSLLWERSQGGQGVAVRRVPGVVAGAAAASERSARGSRHATNRECFYYNVANKRNIVTKKGKDYNLITFRKARSENS